MLILSSVGICNTPPPNHRSKKVNSVNTQCSQTRIYEAVEYGKPRIVLEIHRLWSSPNFVCANLAVRF